MDGLQCVSVCGREDAKISRTIFRNEDIGTASALASCRSRLAFGKASGKDELSTMIIGDQTEDRRRNEKIDRMERASCSIPGYI
jgi:hypothetical protein